MIKELSYCVNIGNNNNIFKINDNNLTNIFLKKSMSIKILIPAKIKLRGEEIGGAFRSIIYHKLKKVTTNSIFKNL